jgi:hypothetical protein
VLRAGYNNTWLHSNSVWSENQRNQALYLHDQLVRDVLLALGQPSPRGIFVHLYLNGLYWGIYNVTEKPDAYFAATYLGGDEADYDVVNSGEISDGDLTAWTTMMDVVTNGVSTAQGYSELKTHLDLDNFVDYMILNQYAQNHDWDNHNWYAIRRRVTGARWKFVSWDSEHTFENVNGNNLSVLNTIGPTYILKALIKNNEFKMYYADHIYKLLYDGALKNGQMLDRFNKLANNLYIPILGESARWGDFRRDVFRKSGPYELYTRDVQWVAERNRLATTFFPKRNDILLSQYRTAGLYPSIDPPEVDKESQVFNDSLNIVISNSNSKGTVYYTLNGSDPRVSGGAVLASALILTGDQTIKLTTTSSVKARVKNGSEWSALKESYFTKLADYRFLVITEIMYNPLEDANIDGDKFEFIEIKNTSNEAINISGLTISGGINYKFTNGTVIDQGGFVVIAKDSVFFKHRYKLKPNGVFFGSLSNDGERISLCDPSGKFIGGVIYRTTEPWPVVAGKGNSIVPVIADVNPDPDNSVNWRSSHNVYGSPWADDNPTTISENNNKDEGFELKAYVTPNPFNAKVTVHLVLNKQSIVRADVFDMQGQIISTIYYKNTVPGVCSFDWNGTTSSGAKALSGVYFCKVRAKNGILYKEINLKLVKN